MKLKHDKLLSNVAFKCKLRHYAAAQEELNACRLPSAAASAAPAAAATAAAR